MAAAKAKVVLRTASAARADRPQFLSALEEGRPLLNGTKAAAGTPSGSKRHWAAVLAWAALAAVYCFAYGRSLMGGTHSRDLHFINDHLNAIARSLVTSMAAFTLLTWGAGAALGAAAAWPARGALAVVHVAFLVYDHGQDFAAHGLYNWVVFLIVVVPLNLVILGLYLWYSSMTPRSFAASLLGVAAVSSVAATIALGHYRHVTYCGFFGHSMQPGCSGPHCPRGAEPNCNFPATTPWIDLLPPGAQNFWTGSQTCKPVTGFEATFSSKGLLIISGCSPGKASYTPFPDTRLWSVERKTHVNAAYQVNVLAELKAQPYTTPVVLNDTEAVLARCGDAERLLTRVARKTARPPPEWPLALRGQAASGSVSTSRRVAEAAGTAGGVGAKAAAAQAQGGRSEDDERLNVLLLFFDSLGRRHFFRRMPKSVAAVEEVASRGTSRLYQFFRYHVMGFHTDPNSHVMYTGSDFDHWQRAQPVWYAYRRAGYVSGSAYNLCEDWGAEYDSMRTPHDHELVAPFCDPEYHPVTTDGEPYQMFKGAFSILRRCLRGRHVHQYNFDYARQFMDAYDKTTPWLFINTFHEAHEGTGEVVGTVDADLAAFLRGLTPEQLNRTAVILVADHGATMGINYMLTANGRITEHKIPLLAMLLPAWLEERHPVAAAALRANEQRLVSHYDFHTTLHHLLHLGQAPPGTPVEQQLPAWARHGNVTAGVVWGTSLLEEVPTGRTCEQATIPPEWCRCT